MKHWTPRLSPNFTSAVLATVKITFKCWFHPFMGVLCTVLGKCNITTYRDSTDSHTDISFTVCERPPPVLVLWIYVTYVDVAVGGTGVWKSFECGCSLSVTRKSRIAGLYLKRHRRASRISLLLLLTSALRLQIDTYSDCQFLVVFLRVNGDLHKAVGSSSCQHRSRFHQHFNQFCWSVVGIQHLKLPYDEAKKDESLHFIWLHLCSFCCIM